MKTVKVSPTGGKRGCACPDGTYSKKCCDGSLQAQGIGSLESQSNSVIINNNVSVTTITQNG
jgi:hypothetical protein